MLSPIHGPRTLFADQLHQEKYRAEGENFRESMNRVASTLTDGNDFRPFREVLLEQRFCPAGRVQAAIGATRRTTAFNCFVSGTIEDSFVEGDGSIMHRASQAASTMRLGGGIGYDFSTLRPRGDLIKKLQSRSSGPISFMEIFDAVGRATSSAGHRRGAQMAVLRVDHPDCEEFIHAKQNNNKLTGFNISLAITDEFMNAVKSQGTYKLRFNGTVYREVEAYPVWEMIMRSTWDWAEPGVIFIDRINEYNNLYYCETIAATNPCSEQPLPPYGACLLGSFNLAKYVYNSSFDYEQFKKDIVTIVGPMDRIVDVSIYPLEEQQKEAANKRRMGLGVMGLANAIEAMGHPYGSEEFINTEKKILDTLRDYSYFASTHLAKTKGSFSLFDYNKYISGKFIKTLPEDIRNDIKWHGIRNSHLLSIAPTGTISMCADNVSSGIEPVFSLSTKRLVNMSNGQQEVTLEDYGVANFGVRGKTCDQVTVKEHLDVLIAAQERVDSAVSKTCNIPSTMEWDEFKNVYMSAWERGAKGCTTFRNGGLRTGILEQSCKYDPATGQKTCE